MGALILKPWRTWQIDRKGGGPRTRLDAEGDIDSRDLGAANTTDDLEEAIPLLVQMGTIGPHRTNKGSRPRR